MTDTFKQVIVLRDDLELSAGKAAAQASHASLCAADRADPEVADAWKDTSMTKVVLAADDESQLRQLQTEAEQAGLPVSVVADEGRTEIEAGTVTALAVGPALPQAVDAVTGDLHLY